jgi:hypothetical protein
MREQRRLNNGINLSVLVYQVEISTLFSIHSTSLIEVCTIPYHHNYPYNVPETMSDSPSGKRKPSASPQASRNPSSIVVPSQDGFTKVESKEERRKRKKVEKRRPQFQFDMSAFRSGKKVGMAVSSGFKGRTSDG